jgi:hypothetical protein
MKWGVRKKHDKVVTGKSRNKKNDRTYAKLHRKQKSKDVVDRVLKKVGNDKVTIAAATNTALSGMRAIQSFINYDLIGGLYYSRQAKRYGDLLKPQ